MRLFNSLSSWVKDFFGSKEVIKLSEKNYARDKAALAFLELALDRASSFIASSISKCEFKTYIDNELIKDRDYYDWNIKSNKNQPAAVFKYKLIYKLVHEKEALVVTDIDGNYLIADSFSKEKFAFSDYQFTNVVVEDFTFQRTFYMKDVLYYEYENDDINYLFDKVCDLYASVLSHAIEVFNESYTQRFKVHVESTGGAGKDDKMDDLFNIQFKKFIKSRRSVIPEYNNLEYKEFGNIEGTINSKDIADIRKDMFNLVANTLRIPPAIIYGDVTTLEESQDSYIANCLNPIVKIIDEVNTDYLYGFEGWKNGCYFSVDTSKVKYFNIFKNASNIDKLIASGYMCIDEVRDETDLKTLDTEFSTQHFMTKNYSSVEDLLLDLDKSKGGNK